MKLNFSTLLHLSPFLLGLLFLINISSCSSGGNSESNDGLGSQASWESLPFTPIKTDYENFGYQTPEGAVVDVLFRETVDSVTRADGQKFPANGKHDYVEYLPIDGSSEHGYLFVNHELKRGNPNLGQWGSMTWMEVKKENGNWQVVGDFNHMDFTPLGGTWHNCGGGITPHNTLLTAEEYPPSSNLSLWYNSDSATVDTSDIDGLRRFEALGWMVEVDLETKKPIRKLYAMGRYSHEDIACMPDDKTVYLTDDAGPGLLFKFVADEAGDYSEGQLYAYGPSPKTQNWIPLPREREALIDARKTGIEAGAYLFSHPEWIVQSGGKVYITESGAANEDWSAAIAMGGKVAPHQVELDSGKVNDVFGSVLVLDPATGEIQPLIKGGPLRHQEAFLNPDGLNTVTLWGRPHLVICEDASTAARRKAGLPKAGIDKPFSGVYLLDLTLPEPNRKNLVPVAVGPRGCEQTGPVFTPDGSTMFISWQRPSSENPEPYNRTAVVAVSGIFGQPGI